ncbi:MAG TPA: hypothetical protein VKS21_03170, partial [Spirochaetota bacterium]|nr:hypothetical protein [Spirochaetota bacterium]
ETLFTIQDFLYEIYTGLEADFDDLYVDMDNFRTAGPVTAENFYYTENDIIYICKGIPELKLINIMLDQYTKKIFAQWNKVRGNAKLIYLLNIFLKMNYYDKFNIYRQYQYFKSSGLKKDKAFLPLYQASYKQGYRQGFKIIKNLLDK